MKPILIAGILGGVLGGALSFAGSRWLAPASAPAKGTPGAARPVPEHAKMAAELYLKKLKEMKYAEFATDASRALLFSEAEAAEFTKKFTQERTIRHGVFGTTSGDIELVRETAISDDLVQFQYLEKFQQGAVLWTFVFYQTKNGWRLHNVVWDPNLTHAFQPGS